MVARIPLGAGILIDYYREENRMNWRGFFALEGPFARFMNRLGDVIWVGWLWIFFSLPILTLGSACEGVYYAMTEGAGKQKNYIFQNFMEGFKNKWKKNFFITFGMLLAFGLLLFDCIYLYGYGTEFAVYLSYVLYTIIAIFLVMSCYYYPCSVTFEGSFFEIFKMAFYLTFRHPLTTICLLINILVAILAIYWLPWSIVVVPGFWWYMESLLVSRLLEQYSKEDEESD